MSKKPTYEELEQWVNELKREVVEHKCAEESLLLSEERYKGIFKNTKNGVAVYKVVNDGQDFIFVDFNEAAEKIEKIKKDALIDKSIAKVFPGVKDFGLFEVFQRVWKTGNPEHCPIAMYKDERIHGWRDNFVYKLSSEEIVAVYSDETQRKQAEEALRESEDRFRHLSEATFEAVIIHDNGVIILANDQFFEMFGYEPHELAGKNVIPLATTPDSAKFIREQISLGNLGPYEATGLKKDGTEFPMEVRIKLMKYNGREIRMASIRDLTELKLSEKALQESEERFRDTATMLPSVIVEYGLDGILTYVNPHGYKIAGYEPEDFEEGFHVLQLAAPEEHEKHYERIQRMMQGEKVPPTEYRLLRKDGSIFWGLVTSSLIHKDGEVVGVRTYTIDISERKEAEEALKERTRELELKTKSLEELNTAMKVLLEKRKEDKTEVEQNVMANVRELISPYFDKINETKLDDHQKTMMNILESNLDEIVSPFTRKLSLKYLNLTPKEIQIVNMIKIGYPSKKIAMIMKVSPRTIDSHRKNIRSKIGLGKKKANLRSHILAHEQ